MTTGKLTLDKDLADRSLPYIATVCIREVSTGKDIWVPAKEYRENPISGTYVVTGRRTPAHIHKDTR